MRKPWNLATVVFGGLAVILLFTGTGCTPKINEEQLTKLRQSKEQSAKLEADIKKKESERASIERELAARQNEVKQSEQKKEFIQQKLQTWPNSWPDWTPAPPPVPATEVVPAPTTKKKGKK